MAKSISKLLFDPERRIQFSTILWFTLALIAVIVELQRGSINNYLIFKNVFWHTWRQENLYLHYPGEYDDLNHYGPLFSLFIFPFAILPDWLGVVLWAMVNAGMLFYAIHKLPVSEENKSFIIVLTAIEMMTSIHNVQFNATVAAWIILSYVFTKNSHTHLACFLIAAGFLIKIYGIVGIVFFVFSKEKMKFIKSLFFWLVFLLVLPAVYSSFSFVYQSYFDWFHAIVDKNAVNIQLTSYGIDISIIGFIRRIFKLSHLPNWYVLLPAAVALTLPLRHLLKSGNLNSQLNYLALLLISVCVFSSSAESPTYVIAVTGVAIWYSISPNRNSAPEKLLILLVIIFTTMSSTDFFPDFLKTKWIKPYSLKALPCFLVWLKILSELLIRKAAITYKLYAA